MKISVLICTIDENIENVKKNILPKLTNIYEVIISHQITKKDIFPEKNFLGENVKYYFKREKGLSKNRNNALKYATGDIGYICDDDVEILPNFEKNILKAYKKVDFDVISFQSLDENDNFQFNIFHILNKFNIFQIYSYGITFKIKKIKQKNIFFNEDFGLGAKYILGEEQIFLNDCLKNGLRLCHFDVAIVKHKDLSSGLKYSDEVIFSRVKVLSHIFGKFISFFLIFVLAFRHFPLYKEKYSVFKFLYLNFYYFFKNEK